MMGLSNTYNFLQAHTQRTKARMSSAPADVDAPIINISKLASKEEEKTPEGINYMYIQYLLFTGIYFFYLCIIVIILFMYFIISLANN